MNAQNSITQPSVGMAWISAIERVLSDGQYVKDGDVSLKEILNLTVSITQPLCDFCDDDILKVYGNKEMISMMENNFFVEDPINGWGYSYAQRIKDFDGINQYAEIVAKLKKNPETKSATIILNKPKDDKKHIPCVNILDFKLRNNTLILNTFFRSQDIAKKMYADAICLSKIAQKVANELDIKNKILNIYVMSAHIYEIDIENAQRIVKNATHK